MNSKMTAVANEIGRSIFQYYNEDYLETLFMCGITIEDVIFQVLVECCRYAYLKNADKHPLKYYIDRDGLELELERKNLKRTIDYVNDRYEIEGTRLQESIGIEILKPESQPVKRESNRFPSYEFSEFQYWELQNIHTMNLVKAIIERRISSSKKISEDRFIEIADQFDRTIQKFKSASDKDSEQTVFSSLVMFTLEGRYAFNFYYQIATEMEARGIKEIPDLKDKLMALSGTYKCCSPLPDLEPQFAHDNDRLIEYPMILQRQRAITSIVNSDEDKSVDLVLSAYIEANVLANAVQSHIYLNEKPMRMWFAENTSVDDWASVFKTYDVFRTFISDKEWSRFKIQAVRKMYDVVSLDYKEFSRKPSIEN